MLGRGRHQHVTTRGRGRGRGQQGEGGEGGGRQQVASCQHPLPLGQLQSSGADKKSDYRTIDFRSRDTLPCRHLLLPLGSAVLEPGLNLNLG